MTVRPSITLCSITNDVEGLQKLIEHTKGQVEKVLVGIQEADDSLTAAFKELGAEVVVLEPERSAYDVMGEKAQTSYVLFMNPGEKLDHPEMLGELIDKRYDALIFPCRNWISGYWSKAFGQHDFEPRMFKPGKVQWDSTTGDYKVPGESTKFWVFECWIDRQRTLDEVRASAAEPIVSQQAVQRRQESLAAAEAEHARRPKRGEKIRILFYYRGGTTASNTLMTLPAIREARRQYPKAEIVYRTNRGDMLGQGKRRGAHLYDCLHPDIDYINDDIMPINDITREYWETEVKYEADFDLTFHWEKSMESEEEKTWNGYELEAAWLGLTPSDGNYKPDWTFAKGEEKFGRSWVKKQCKTKRCIGVVLTANDGRRMWPFVEDWINAMLAKYPDVTIMTFGYIHPELLELRYMRRAFDVPAELMTFDESSRVKQWYDPKRVVNCLTIDPKIQRYFPRKQRGVGLNLRQQAAIYPSLDLLVTPNSAPMHIAAALGVPTIAYFNTVWPQQRMKHLDSVSSLCAEYQCPPCHNEYVCAKDTWTGALCLRTITVEQMMQEVEKRLAESPRRR